MPLMREFLFDVCRITARSQTFAGIWTFSLRWCKAAALSIPLFLLQRLLVFRIWSRMALLHNKNVPTRRCVL
jgi:hypothetical protein